MLWEDLLLHLCFLLMFFGGGDAASVLEKSIAYHDPDGVWDNFNHTLSFEESRPDGTVRKTEVLMNLPGEHFHYAMEDGKQSVERIYEKGQCRAFLNGSSEISDEDKKKNRLTCEQIVFYRNYYQYLWGLPMKLRDPGTNLHPEVTRTTFIGKEVLAIRVNYEGDVGSDEWHFFLDPQTYAMIGYQFFKPNEKGEYVKPKGKGEYIVLEGEYQLGSMRLPKARTWYVNTDDRILGTDTLVGHK